mmetsp:Transcript_72863/g.210948  ORF Transcript_72863/g.210948 Transcript_72863/m.210948 type:complete len:355 (-) Transcript_72863:62-1126(-)
MAEALHRHQRSALGDAAEELVEADGGAVRDAPRRPGDAGEDAGDLGRLLAAEVVPREVGDGGGEGVEGAGKAGGEGRHLSLQGPQCVGQVGHCLGGRRRCGMLGHDDVRAHQRDAPRHGRHLEEHGLRRACRVELLRTGGRWALQGLAEPAQTGRQVAALGQCRVDGCVHLRPKVQDGAWHRVHGLRHAAHRQQERTHCRVRLAHHGLHLLLVVFGDLEAKHRNLGDLCQDRGDAPLDAAGSLVHRRGVVVHGRGHRNQGALDAVAQCDQDVGGDLVRRCGDTIDHAPRVRCELAEVGECLFGLPLMDLQEEHILSRDIGYRNKALHIALARRGGSNARRQKSHNNDARAHCAR